MAARARELAHDPHGLVGATAAAIRAAVAAGQVSPVTVARAHLDHIARLDGVIGAFQTVRDPQVRTEAQQLAARTDLDRLPLAGVPVVVKDNLAIAGTPVRRGTTATPADPAPADDPLVARVRAAGALLLGTTRMPELGLWPVTEPRAFGPTRNPWDLSRTAGGSSGGAGAALAAAMAPLALGSDGAGSIRIPAACCGVVGLKPGTGVVPTPQPGGRSHWHGMTVWGPMATTVADLALLLQVLTSPDPGGHTRPPRPAPAVPSPPAPSPPAPSPPEAGLHADGGQQGERRRVAVCAKAPAPGIQVHAADRAAMDTAAAALAEAGHEVTRTRPPYRNVDVVTVIQRILTGTAQDAAEVTWQALEPRTRRQARAGQLLGVAGNREEAAQQARRRFIGWFAAHGVHALLTPALAAPPPKIGVWARRGVVWTMTASARFMPFAPLANLTGLPAITLPTTLSPDGHPVAVQLLGPPDSEPLLLRLAAELERARPWPRHAPLATRHLTSGS